MNACVVSADLRQHLADTDRREREEDRDDRLRDEAVRRLRDSDALSDFFGDSEFADAKVWACILTSPEKAAAACADLREQFDLTMGTRILTEIGRIADEHADAAVDLDDDFDARECA